MACYGDSFTFFFFTQMFTILCFPFCLCFIVEYMKLVMFLGVAQVASEGMDDTRMDLTQLEESGTGRSVPTTPLQVSPQGTLFKTLWHFHMSDSLSTLPPPQDYSTAYDCIKFKLNMVLVQESHACLKC
jgi:hypothetical protein